MGNVISNQVDIYNVKLNIFPNQKKFNKYPYEEILASKLSDLKFK